MQTGVWSCRGKGWQAQEDVAVEQCIQGQAPLIAGKRMIGAQPRL